MAGSDLGKLDDSSPRYFKSRISALKNKFTIALVFLGIIAIGLLVGSVILGVQLSDCQVVDEETYPLAKVEFIVWDNPNVWTANKNRLLVKAPHNATLFTVMEHAALQADSHRFEYLQYTFGKYVFSIGGVREDTVKGLFWMLYKLTDIPNPSNPPSDDMMADRGIDDLRVRKTDGDVYLFWLKMETQPHARSQAQSEQRAINFKPINPNKADA